MSIANDKSVGTLNARLTMLYGMVKTLCQKFDPEVELIRLDGVAMNSMTWVMEHRPAEAIEAYETL